MTTHMLVASFRAGSRWRTGNKSRLSLWCLFALISHAFGELVLCGSSSQ